MLGLLDGILSRQVRVLVHKDKGHQHPERICTKILHKMKLIVIKGWLVVTIQTASCTKVLLSEYLTIGLQGWTIVLLGVPKK